MKRDESLIIAFIELYSNNLSEDVTRKASYEATESIWIQQTGERFYRNYNTFVACRNRFFKIRDRSDFSRI